MQRVVSVYENISCNIRVKKQQSDKAAQRIFHCVFPQLLLLILTFDRTMTKIKKQNQTTVIKIPANMILITSHVLCQK